MAQEVERLQGGAQGLHPPVPEVQARHALAARRLRRVQALVTLRSQHAVVAEALDAQQASVGLEADRFDLLEVAQQSADGEVAGLVDGRFGAQGAPQLAGPLDAECL